ncbi:hypothetical protein KAR91_45400 [Candidatus Pacearchaeota archaeon]|nr:hypothetical protein [Candidatus Pacearchaeota archaeon]
MEDQAYLAEILPRLKGLMPFKWRVQSFSKHKSKATCVAYIDARDVMDRLDEVCTYGWHRNHEELKGRIYAGVGIILPSGKVMWRWDCGTESNTEAEKGESSDSFKRAAVNTGVGRFLYDLDIQYVDANEKKTSSNYPYVVDNKGKRVWDITKHIGGGSKPYTKPKEVNKGEDMTVELLVSHLPSCKTIESLDKYMKDNSKFVKGLFEKDKKEVIAEFSKRKVEITELGGSSQAQQ